MDETVVADVEADVGDSAATHRAEEHHVARLQFATRYADTHFCLCGGSAREVYAHRAFEDMLHETAAVETCGRRCAAVAVGYAQKPHRAADEFVCIV